MPWRGAQCPMRKARGLVGRKQGPVQLSVWFSTCRILYVDGKSVLIRVTEGHSIEINPNLIK